jgi:outer membrane protein OmpA-like peptidoglycan-associated protein
MHRTYLYLSLLLFVFTMAQLSIIQAQTPDNKIITGVEATFVDYKGVVNNEVFKPGNFNPGLRLTANIYLNKWMNYAVTSSFIPKASYPQPFNTGFLPQLLMDFNTGVQVKVNNGVLFREEARFAPYLYTGIGFNTTEGQNGFYAPIALGMRLRLTHTMSLNFETMYRQKFGGAIQPRSHSLGFVFVLPTNKPKTQPIATKNDKNAKANTAKNKEGLANSEPKEQKVAVISSKPSSHDGDPKPAKITPTPVEKKAVVATSVKPKTTITIKDRDKDGIADDKDGCPDEYGAVEQGGCPTIAKVDKSKLTDVEQAGDKDTDGDGILDRLDGCPSEPGLQKDGGCPLRYAVAQSIDARIDRSDILTSKSSDVMEEKVANPTFNTPLPSSKRERGDLTEVKAKDLDRLAIIAKSLQFVAGSDSLMPSSKPLIAELNAILAKYPQHRLEVSGFYGTAKDEESNQVMSVLRAHKIKSLLLLTQEQKYNRLKTNGYGSTNTAAGVEKNRLEMKLMPM